MMTLDLDHTVAGAPVATATATAASTTAADGMVGVVGDDEDDDDDDDDDNDDDDDDDDDGRAKAGPRPPPGSTSTGTPVAKAVFIPLSSNNAAATAATAPKLESNGEVNGQTSGGTHAVATEEDKITAGFSVGVAEDRNKKFRRTMEDAHKFLYNFGDVKGQGFFAIYDGHAGRGAADWCGAHLHETLQKLIEEQPAAPVSELLNQCFLMTDDQLRQKKTMYSGCTAVVALVRVEDREIVVVEHPDDDASPTRNGSQTGEKRKGGTSRRSKMKVKRRVLYTANVGDARVVLSRNGQAVRLSYDHKGSDAQESQRIIGSGGFVVNNRVNGVLAVTRALGDITMKDWVIGSPYTTETVLEDNDDFLILACDGLWDVCSDQTAIDHVKETRDPQKASEELLALALEKCSTDNLSVLVVRLHSSFIS